MLNKFMLLALISISSLPLLACKHTNGDSQTNAAGRRPAHDSSVTGAAKGPVAFDVNDVSLAFPMATNITLPSFLHVSGNPDGFRVLDDQDFKTLTNSAPQRNPQAEFGDPSAWIIVGVRFDPCAFLNPLKDPCQPQLRLVAQPFDQKAEYYMDHALHLVFNLPSSAVPDVIKTLVQLKSGSSVVTNGIPLGVHPVMLSEGIAGAFAKGLIKMVKENCTSNNLFLAAATITDIGKLWQFATTAKANGQLQQIPVPFPKGPTILFSNNASIFGPNTSFVRPESDASDNVNRIIDSAHGTNPRPLARFYTLAQAE